MPVKRRKAKTRLRDQTPLSAWRIFFKAGHDFLKDLRPYGIHSNDEAQAAAPEAWLRLGEEFMAGIGPQPDYAMPPWALETFGKPWEAKSAD